MAIIETERLILRPVDVNDAEAIFKWAGDPEVNTYMIYPLHKDIEVTKYWLSNMRDPEGSDEFDLGFVLKETGELIGMGGLVKKKGSDEWTVGYNLRKDYWGRGLVPEAIKAIMEYVIKERGAKVFVGEVAKDNAKSRRVMEKLGLSVCGEGQYSKFDDSATFDCFMYRREH